MRHLVFTISGPGKRVRVTSADPRRALDEAIAQAEIPELVAKRIRTGVNATIVDMPIHNAVASYRISELLCLDDIRYNFGESGAWAVDIGTIDVVTGGHDRAEEA
jgi:hypothetical protein